MPAQHIDRATIAGLGLLLMPLLTMWHEIGGHAAACALQGGRAADLGAFYVNCRGLGTGGDIVVAVAGVTVNIALSLVAWRVWRGARADVWRLFWWLVWVSEGFVAAGYFCFSGITGFGDLGTGAGGSLQMLPSPLAWRVAEAALGIASYVWLVRRAIRALTAMLGDAPTTRAARRGIAHVYYATCGVVAVLVGLLNPLGLWITILSAAASSFGGLAGFISIGFAVPSGERAMPFVISRRWSIILGGAATSLVFATILGRTLHV